MSVKMARLRSKLLLDATLGIPNLYEMPTSLLKNLRNFKQL